jgi:hypothetical protein
MTNILYDYLQHIAPKKWFELIKSDLTFSNESLGTVDLFELEQALVRQQSKLKKSMSTGLNDYLSFSDDTTKRGVGND